MAKKYIVSRKNIKAADEKEDTRVADLTSIIKDDFNYALDGFDKMDREGNTDQALQILAELKNAVDNAIEASAEVIAE